MAKRFLFALALVLTASLAGSPISRPADPPGEPGQVFMLQDYRWVQVNVRRTPTAIQANFEVINGNPSVHAELISARDFALFSHRHDYDALALTPTGPAGKFRYLAKTPGRYLVVIMNDRGAPPAAVSLLVRTEVDPVPSTLSTGITPRRRLVVVLASLTLFFGTVTWSGRKLLRAYRQR